MGKRKNKKSYPRTNTVSGKKNIMVAADEPVIAHYNNGRFWLSGRNGRVLSDGPYTFSRTYQGENRGHIVAAATNLPQSTANVGSWVDNFDVIYAMDTNTKKCGELYISVGVVCRGDIVRETKVSGTIGSQQWLVFHWYHDGTINIEPKTWIEALKVIGVYEKAEARVGIVVDSEYNKLSDFNDRKLPLHGNYYLPENRWMMYASADRTDEWCNKMIRQCDAIATEQLAQLVWNPEIVDPAEVTLGPVLGRTIADKELLPYLFTVTVVKND